MLIFRELEIQIAPRPLLFLENPEPGSRILQALELPADTPVYCSVKAGEEGFDPAEYYEINVDGGISGIAVVGVQNESCDIYVFISVRQMDFFVSSLNAVGAVHRSIRLNIDVDAGFNVVRGSRVYSINGAPRISISMASDQ